MKDALYFKHDGNARNDPKIKALIKKYKIEGYGRFWVIIEMFRESNGYKLEDEEYIWDALAEQMQCETKEVKAFVKDCVEKFKLFVQEDGFFYSPSFIQRMSHLDEIRQKRSAAAYSMHEKAGHNITKDSREPTGE
jgi:hypothetical protein